MKARVVSQEFLDKVRKFIGNYRWHLRGCEIDDSDFCTCGMKADLVEINNMAKNKSHYGEQIDV